MRPFHYIYMYYNRCISCCPFIFCLTHTQTSVSILTVHFHYLFLIKAVVKFSGLLYGYTVTLKCTNLLVEVEVDPDALPGLWLAEEERSCDPLVISSSSWPTSPTEALLSCLPPPCCPEDTLSISASPAADGSAGSSPSGPLSPPVISSLWSHISGSLSSRRGQQGSSCDQRGERFPCGQGEDVLRSVSDDGPAWH